MIIVLCDLPLTISNIEITIIAARAAIVTAADIGSIMEIDMVSFIEVGSAANSVRNYII